METPTSQPVTNLVNRFNSWIQESIMVKLFSIGFLVLILLIPSAWIDDLIYERQQRAEDVIDEISEKWSDSQTLSGPILVIPYTYHEKITKANNETEVYEKTENAFFLPESLNVSGKIEPQVLHRGIFETVVYGTDLDMKAEFSYPDFKGLNIPEEMVQWKNAHLISTSCSGRQAAIP
jgi:inner membrane protein